MIAEPASQQTLTTTPRKPKTVTTAKGVPNRSALGIPSHDTHPQTPGRQTAEPTTIIPTETASKITGRFISDSTPPIHQ
jgi:hypothetical protein